MASIFQSLLLVIATSSQRELARQVKYLKVENQILRSKLPTRVTVTAKERERLMKFGARLGKALQELVTIVAPGTFLRWIREAKRDRKSSSAKRGRPRTAEDIRKLIVLMARDNGWGYARIAGELKKLRITSVSRSTIRNILKEAGLQPGPKRDEGTWDEFLKQHAASLWQCDFFSQKVLTIKGFREVFMIAFIHVQSRRVVLSPATEHPDETWVVAQAERFATEARAQDLSVAYVVHDRDTKFTRSFDQTLKRKRVRTVKIAHCAPDMQAYVERFIQTLKNEVLRRFVVFGTQHLEHLTSEYLAYYHADRPHQGVGNELLVRPQRKRGRPPKEDEPVSFSLKQLRCEKRLGGLLKSYRRAA
jgi:putative transposase